MKQIKVQSQYNEAEVEAIILDWFRQNPNPDDPDVHELAGRLGMEPEILEKVIYRLFTKMMQRDKVIAATTQITLTRFPYGNTSPAYKKAKEWLTKNGTNGSEYFEFPDYAGMPKSISKGLSTDEVDHIQNCWPTKG